MYRSMVQELCDREKWIKIRDSEDYELLRIRLFDGYKKFCEGQEIPSINFSDEMDFLHTGTRVNFENLYFTRRKQLTIYAILSMIYPKTEEYIKKLEDIIWAICSENTWVLPAHRFANWLNKRDGIDLFAAETALYLVEIKHMLAGIISPIIAERITSEVKTRIIDSFECENCWFETLHSNWAAVCGGSVGAVLIYECPEKFLKLEKRIYKCMENYLLGIGDDGGTSEGTAYWVYGFSFYVMFNDILRRHTFGRENNFVCEKVKKTAGFFSACCLDENNIVTFSDVDALDCTRYPIWLMHFLKNEYDIELPNLSFGDLTLNSFSHTVRSFLYYNKNYGAGDMRECEHYFDKLEWYIRRGKNYGFAVKGGNNAEMHNHNDVGSFIITDTKRQVLCDLGSSEYTAQTGVEARYKILNYSSLGHSVPIVNGNVQEAGAEYSAKLSVCQNTVSVDMTKAYPARCNCLVRTFELSDMGITLHDSFDPNQKITERFVSEIEPLIKGNEMTLGGMRCVFDKKWRISVTFEDIKAHDGITKRRIYLIDFETDDAADSFTLDIKRV